MKNNANLAQPEIALRIDASGVIRKALFSSEIADEGLGNLVGQRWADTVGGTGAQVLSMIDHARENGVSPIQRVRQRFPSGVEVSVEYTAVKLGAEGGFIAIGRNLEVIAGMRLRVVSTQREMARDSWKLHDVATRHRLLGDASSDPVVVVDADTLIVADANLAARRALGVAIDVELLSRIAPVERESLRTTLERLRAHGEAPEVVMNLGVDGRRWHTRASTVQADRGAMLVLRLSAAGPTAAVGAHGTPPSSPMARLRDSVVVVSATGTIVRANTAFLELTETRDEASLVGTQLDRWLSPLTLSTVLADYAKNGGGSALTAVVRCESGAESGVEVYAVEAAEVVCVVLHRVQRARRQRGLGGSSDGAEPDEETMRWIIEDGVSHVERRCFLAALELAKTNRRNVAEILGMDAEGPSSPVRAGS